MIISEVGRTTAGSSSSLPPPWVTTASSGAKPSTWSASRVRYDCGISSGKYAFCVPVALIRASISACIRSHSPYPYGRITMVPRTGPLSASSALAIRSWYQRGKSSDCGVSTVLAMTSILRSGARLSTAVGGLLPLHRRHHEGLPGLSTVRELAGTAGLLEDARGGGSRRVVEVAGDLHVGATPHVPAHRLHRLDLRVGPPDEPGPLGSEAAQVDVDVVVVRRVEEVGQHVGELMVQPSRGAPVEGQAPALLRGRGVAPLVVAQRGEVAPVGAQPRDVN